MHFSDDITEAEIAAMARDHGFVVRHTNGMTVVDRVPHWLRKAPLLTNVVPLALAPRGRKVASSKGD